MNRFPFHFQAKDSEDIVALRNAGFDSREISRLCQLRRTYKLTAQDQPELPQKHLLFIRWLIEHGKIREDLP